MSGGFTLVEVLLVIVAVSVITSVGYFTVVTVKDTVREKKLEADVTELNSSVQAYLANGGNLPADATAGEVLAKLKTRASETSAVRSIGLTGSFADARIEAVWQTGDEASSSQIRAVWNPSQNRFVLLRSGATGIKEFQFNEALAGQAPVNEQRTNSLAAATETEWVWDYADNTGAVTSPGTAPSAGAGAGYTVPTANSPDQLSEPGFSNAGGTLALGNFDIPLTLSNPNPAGTSQIYYSVSSSPYVLYRGEVITVTPGTEVGAYAKSVDPDHWTDSNVELKSYDVTPLVLDVSISAPSPLTYATAGGTMLQNTQSAPTATVTLDNASEIPAKYLNSAKFSIQYTVAAGDAQTGPSFSETFVSPQIAVGPPQLWGAGAQSLTLTAQAIAADSQLFASSAVATATITISQLALSAPEISPPTGQRSANVPVTISIGAATNYPVGYQIFYTTDGSDPGAVSNGHTSNAAATLYTGTFTPGAGTNGVLVVNARAYGPAGYEHWFSSSVAQVTYTSPATVPEGALVGSAEIYGAAFEGSIVYAKPAAGQSMSDISFTGGAKILKGNLYLPGTPNIYNGWIGDPVKWTLAKDSTFATRILGRQFTSDGVEITDDPTWSVSPRVVDLGETTTPNNYNVVFYSDSYIEGKVYRQNDPPSLPTVSAPPNKDGNNTLDYGTYRIPPSGGLSASTVANATINSGTVPLKLLPGHFGALQANNGTTIQLGDASNPDVTQYYTAESLNLNGGSKLAIVGKVVITLKNKLEINNGSVLGNINHPEWLTLQFYTTSTSTPLMFAANSGSQAYAAIVASNGEVDLNNGSTFNGSVAAKKLKITSSSVVFSIPPVIAQ